MARDPQDPPIIPNVTYVKYLGGGGFADVFMYRQRMPERDVAIKVLRRDADAEQSGSFEAEANLMAKMSAHPAIVSVFNAGVTEDGRSYIVMEYCPPPDMSKRAAARKLSVARVLEMGIMIAGAVETLHRAGILHRDIKPANILMTQFDHPVLIDFGIALSTEPGADKADSGFSLPWAPPQQALGESNIGPTLDVYSLAATIYTFLAGHSPFDIPGGDNREIAMLNRVLNDPVPRTGREDVPVELERVLAIAMSKDPAHRYQTVEDFAHALQQIQVSLYHRATRLDVLETNIDRNDSDDDDAATHLRPIQVIDPHQKFSDAATPSGSGWSPGTASDETTARPRRYLGEVATSEVENAFADATSITPSPSTPSGVSQEQKVPQFTTLSEAELATLIAAYPPPPAPPEVAKGGSTARSVLSHKRANREGADDPHGGTAESAEEEKGGIGRKIALAVGVVAVVAILIFGGRTLLRGEGGSFTTDDPTTSDAGELPVTSSVAPVTDLVGAVEDDKVRFSWKSDAEDVTFIYSLVDPLETQQVRDTKEKTAVVEKLDNRTCLEVLVRDANGKSSAPANACVDTP